jgi:hypothetical protein
LHSAPDGSSVPGQYLPSAKKPSFSPIFSAIGFRFPVGALSWRTPSDRGFSNSRFSAGVAQA